MRLVSLAALATTLAATPLAAQQAPQQQAAAPAMPEVGTLAPDFTIRGVSRQGIMEAPISLSALRGRTVVLAFFPSARTRGCTVQLETYRDRYDELFAGGKDVVVVAVSTDADTTLASWAREANFPMLFGSDADQVVSRAYGSLRGNYSSRNLFVIGPDGRISHRMSPFNVLSQDAYAELASAVKAAAAGGAASASGEQER